MILHLDHKHKHHSKSKIKFHIILFSILCILYIPYTSESQTVIIGTVYDFSKNEPLAGYWVVRTDSIMTDSISPKNLDGVSSEYLSVGYFDGNFTIINPTNKNTDLLINFFRYHNTIIKDIPHNKDTVHLSYIPLFIDDDVIRVTLILNRRQKFFSRFRKKYWHNQSIIGTEGPFSYKRELIINCLGEPDKKIICKKEKNGIEIDYKDLKTCGNK